MAHPARERCDRHPRDNAVVTRAARSRATAALGCRPADRTGGGLWRPGCRRAGGRLRQRRCRVRGDPAGPAAGGGRRRGHARVCGQQRARGHDNVGQQRRARRSRAARRGLLNRRRPPGEKQDSLSLSLSFLSVSHLASKFPYPYMLLRPCACSSTALSPFLAGLRPAASCGWNHRWYL